MPPELLFFRLIVFNMDTAAGDKNGVILYLRAVFECRLLILSAVLAAVNTDNSNYFLKAHAWAEKDL